MHPEYRERDNARRAAAKRAATLERDRVEVADLVAALDALDNL